MFSIEALACAVPKKSVSNLTYPLLTEKDRQRFVKIVGIENRRWGDQKYCSSDYCFEAAKAVIKRTGVDLNQIKFLIYVTQTPDYFTPATACVLQHRLGLPTNIAAFDINLGCSGFTYGLMILQKLLKGTGGHGLLLCGDSPSKTICEKDQTTAMLFSDAGSACLVSDSGYDGYVSDDSDGFEPIYDFNTDGSGAGAICVKSGYRNGFDLVDLVPDENGKTGLHLTLDGPAVMDFAVSQVPFSVNRIKENIGDKQVDNYFFHQANKVVNDTIAIKLGLKPKDIPSTLKDFGNTSSASIPLTMIKMGQEYFTEPKNLMLSGFGVGLSWCSMFLHTRFVEICDLIEVE